MNAGTLDRRVLIEYPVITQDPTYGSESVAWVSLGEVPCEAVDVLPSRAESVSMGLAQARNQTRIRMRWRSDINSAMRLTLRGDVDVVLQIVAGPAESMKRKDFIEMVCEQYTTAGRA